MKNIIYFVLMALFLLAGIKGVFLGGTSTEVVMLEFLFGFICGAAIWQNKKMKKIKKRNGKILFNMALTRPRKCNVRFNFALNAVFETGI